jgi:DNA-binding transcriptional MerR regulator
MPEYTVKKLAKLSGLTVRALHHYDSIGLLRPSKRTDAGYRVYKEKDLLKLQQILFYRELEFPLDKIKRIINRQGFDMVKALESHKKMLLDRHERTKKLVITIDKTIKKLKEEETMLKDEDLYEGFSKEEAKKLREYAEEAAKTYDPGMVKESYQRVRKLTKEQWQNVKKEGEDNTKRLASLMSKDPASKEVQDAIAKHYAHLNNFYTPNLVMYRGLGNLYVTDGRFRAHYDKYAKGLADFIKKAIDIFCDKKGDRV